MKTEIGRIISLLQHTYEKDAWHGPSVKEVLQSVTQESSGNRLPQTHSIIELVAHMATWRVFVTKKLEGDLDYKVPPEMNFPRKDNWAVVMSELEYSQKNLLAALEKFPEGKLYQLVDPLDYKHTYHTLLHGIIHHDLYHTGQIMLIVKATAAQSL